MGLPQRKEVPLELPPENYCVEERIAKVKLMSPRPAVPHASVASALGALLMPSFDQRFMRHKGSGPPGGGGGWRILDEPELHFGDDILVPDLAGWRILRMARRPNSAFITKTPDWVCEVLSPSTHSIDRYVKLPVYLQKGVEHVWLVSEPNQTIEILKRVSVRGGGHTYKELRTLTGKRRVRAEPFESLALDLDILWS